MSMPSVCAKSFGAISCRRAIPTADYLSVLLDLADDGEAPESHGGGFADAFGVNPLKLAWGYQQLARNAGAMIHTASPVQQWQTDGRTQVLHTPQAVVRARKVILATNGYTPKQLHPGVQSRTLPVLSQIIVTEPLSAAQLAAVMP